MNKRLKNYFIILNEKGLHTRPSTELVKCASKFDSQITLQYQNMSVNAKSILGVLMLAAVKGAVIEVTAEGIDAKEAIEALTTLAENKFNIQY